MILTNCVACAAPLAHDAPRCVRCWTRYCDLLIYSASKKPSRAALRARDTTYIERDLQDARAELSARTDEMHDPNKGMADIVKFFAAIKPYDGGKETE